MEYARKELTLTEHGRELEKMGVTTHFVRQRMFWHVFTAFEIRLIVNARARS